MRWGNFSTMTLLSSFRLPARLTFLFSALAIALCLSALAAPASAAETPEEAAKAYASLPPAAQQVMARLATLAELPEGTWISHSGDLAHGEAVALDESSWKAAPSGSKVSGDAVWFRQVITIPATLHGYDLTNSRIWFQFHANANGPMPQILYFNGRRVAMGDDLEPIVLLEDAQPGEKITVAIKLLRTVDEKSFNGATLRVDFPTTRPNPEDLRKEFQSAVFLVPSFAPGDASKMATLANAVEAVDLKALDNSDQKAFDASLTEAHYKLGALRPLLQQGTLHLTGNSHIDAAWLWPWTETVDVVKRTFGTALQLMYEYPQYTYTQSAAQYNEWMAQKYPDLNADINRRIKEGRWEIVGGMWVEPDLNMPDGESLVRQLLVGKRWCKQAYGVDVRIGWNPDSFGYNWQLPQIYKKSGVDYFVTQKMTWNDTNQLPFKLFWWESPDGSKVLTYFPNGYGNDDLDPVRLTGDLSTARTRATGETEIMDLYGIGDHGGGPTRAVLDEGDKWVAASKTDALPKMQFGIAQTFFSSVEKQIAPDSPEWNYASIAKGYTPPPAVAGQMTIPTWKSELYFEYHRGVMTTQANHKRNMRDSEEQVLNAEKWASLAWLDGKPYPGLELTEDWKKVLLNQFHDLAAGSGIGVIYKDAQKDYDVVRWSTNEIGSGALGLVTDHINTAGAERSGDSIVVFNPLAWARTGGVQAKVHLAAPGTEPRIADLSVKGHLVVPTVVSREPGTDVAEISFLASDVPALGYKVFHLTSVAHGTTATPAPHAPKQEPAGKELILQSEKDGLAVRVSTESGCITSIRDEKSKFEYLAPNACGNQLQAFADNPKDYDAWNIDPGTLDVAPYTFPKADSVELAGDRIHPAVRVTRTWQKSKFVQTISLHADQVDIDNEIDWHESHVLLKAAFPLSVSSDHATYEIPYGSIERTTKRTNSWEKAQFEVPAMRWADLGDGAHGLSVINNSKYGYDAAGNVLRLTLLRSPKWPDPDAEMGHHHFNFALYPHAGTWQQALTVRHGWEYNYPLTAVVTTAHPGSLPASHSFASVSPDNVVLTAVKKAEDTNSLIFRAYEWAGNASTVDFHVPPGATAATVTNMMETPEGNALTIAGDTIKAPIKPFEILTIRVGYPESK